MAVAASAGAVALRVPMEPWLQGRLVYVLMFPIAAALALRSGFCAGLISIAAYLAFSELFLVSAGRSISTGPTLVAPVVSALLGVGLVLICSYSRALRLEAERAAAEARRAQERLRCSEERFRLAARAARDMIYDLDITTGRIEWNEALEALGYTQRETDLHWWAGHVHPDDRQQVSRSLEEAFGQRRASWQAEYRFALAAGGYADILDRAYVIYAPDGRPARLVGAMVDVTESRNKARRLAEQAAALTRSNRDLEDFAYIISHDLKEPLRGISTLAKMLLEDGPELQPLARDRVELLQRLPRRMSEQMDALLEFSRLGHTEFSIGETDLGVIVRDVLDQLSTWLCEQGATVALGELPTMRCDPVRVRQIFHNLIVNGVKYNRQPRKRIVIGAAGGTDPPVLFVGDNGIGIPEHHHATVFGMFRRLHPHNHYGGGAGAGLALVKKIVDRHGGRIWVESSPEEGAIFKFTLAPAREKGWPEPSGIVEVTPSAAEWIEAGVNRERAR
jgi:PAS domain S-box-containing protein